MLADLNLIVQIAMGVALVAGMALARAGRIRAHQICQTSVVLLNLALIGGIMAPSLDRQAPHAGDAFRSAYFAVPLVHAALGTVTEVLALYIVLVAGTSLVPQSLRFTNAYHCSFHGNRGGSGMSGTVTVTAGK